MFLKENVKNKTMYEAFFNYRNIFLDSFMIILSVIFLGIMANVGIPLWPVPITMQTFGVFTIAFFFGSKKGLLSITAYIAAGLMGFAVFSGKKYGIGAILGPTGGYIIGFIFMVLVVGWMIEKGYGRDKKSVLLCMLIGEIILYLFGLTGLWIFFGKVPILKVLQLGLFPFLIGDAIKIIIAVSLFPLLWKGSEKFTR